MIILANEFKRKQYRCESEFQKSFYAFELFLLCYSLFSLSLPPLPLSPPALLLLGNFIQFKKIA